MSIATLDALDDRDTDETISDSSLVYDLDVRAELWEPDLSAPYEDISEWLSVSGSSVSYADAAAVRHTARLQWSGKVDWNKYRIKLFVDIVDREQKFVRHTASMGVYIVDAWSETLGTSPSTFETECVDLMALLDQPVGSTYTVPTGTDYTHAIRDAIEAASSWNRFAPLNVEDPIGPRVRVAVNDDEAFVVGSRIVPVAENHTWLDIVNHLCEGAGYRRAYVDRDGVIVVDAERLTTESVTLDYTDAMTVIAEGTKVTTDLRLRPNQWVIFGELVEPSIPGPAHAQTLLLHQTDAQASTGEHSFESRGNRVVPRVYSIDAASQLADLVTGFDRSTAFSRAAARLIDDDRESTHQMTMRMAPTTRLWHGDLLRLTNAGNGSGYWRVVEWSLSFDGSPMSVRLVRR